jgi:hypothetical protein
VNVFLRHNLYNLSACKSCLHLCTPFKSPPLALPPAPLERCQALTSSPALPSVFPLACLQPTGCAPPCSHPTLNMPDTSHHFSQILLLRAIIAFGSCTAEGSATTLQNGTMQIRPAQGAEPCTPHKVFPLDKCKWCLVSGVS